MIVQPESNQTLGKGGANCRSFSGKQMAPKATVNGALATENLRATPMTNPRALGAALSPLG